MGSALTIFSIFEKIDPVDVHDTILDGVQPDPVQDFKLVCALLAVEVAVVGVCSILGVKGGEVFRLAWVGQGLAPGNAGLFYLCVCVVSIIPIL